MIKNNEENSENEHNKDNKWTKKENEKEVVVAPEVGPGEHKLQYSYWLWFSRRSPGKQSSQSYDQNLKLIATFASVEQFWANYSHLARPSELQSHSDFHLFKVGIKPMWEDEANQRGGRWMVRLRKGLASRCWENLVLAMLGEQFMVGHEICGAVISIRFQEDILCVWNRTASDQATTARIRDTIRRILHLPPNTILEYKTHNDSLIKSMKLPPGAGGGGGVNNQVVSGGPALQNSSGVGPVGGGATASLGGPPPATDTAPSIPASSS